MSSEYTNLARTFLTLMFTAIMFNIVFLSQSASAAPARIIERDSLDDLALTKRYKPGWCGLHFVQYQKNEGPGPARNDYRFTITIKDAAGAVVGGTGNLPMPIYQSSNLPGALPYSLVMTPGNVDSDPLRFAYAGQSWSSSDGTCSVGIYDRGSRQGDCGFTC
ncbi:hypothetical protein AMS68_002200 [Peltaster fructicola]|uniref:Uncharacterized protein n=1 Tax=Peltaster fructicola TaxID=286661 RepID=A0A6H0XPP7_9PEZI|nr:hypothetical protein AMS68_002200 [Peltaster fructicola]